MTSSASLYHFLSLCLLYPQPDLILQLRQAAATAGLPEATELAAVFAKESLETLQVEHTHLFVNNAQGVPCPPYEAAYIDGQLLTATTAAVAAAYARWGIEHSLETADFLPVELQFVAYLAELAEQSEQHDTIDLARRRFQAEHLQPWLSRFAADLQQHATVACYRQAGKLLAGLALQIESN